MAEEKKYKRTQHRFNEESGRLEEYYVMLTAVEIEGLRKQGEMRRKRHSTGSGIETKKGNKQIQDLLEG